MLTGGDKRDYFIGRHLWSIKKAKKREREHRLPVSLCRTQEDSALAGAESVHETAEKTWEILQDVPSGPIW